MRHLYDVIIIGGGPGGYTAALYAARAGLDTLVLEKLSAGGQMALTTQIDNYPGFEAGIDGFTLGEKMQQGAERFGAKTEIVEVDGVHLQGPVKTVHTNEGIFEAKTVILAMGAHPRKLGIPDEARLVGHGLHYCAACDGMFYKDKTVVVVGGGNSAADFGSPENLCLALIVLVVILAVKHATTGFVSASSILVGIVVGYVVAGIMGLVLPTTGINSEGVEYTKAWVLNWDKVAAAAWFAIPNPLPVAPVFDMRAIAPVLVMFIVTAVETVGDISGVTQGGMDREATDKELSGGVVCDGVGSSFAALFGVLPNTSFSQNVGLVTMTKMVNRKALACGAVFLILCGLCPKLGAVVSIMPQSVLGGAAVIMFASIVVSGIQLITRDPLTPRNLSIVSVALGLGYGIGANPAILAGSPQMVSLIFGGSGIVAAAAVAIVLNVVLPKDKAIPSKTDANA